MSRFCRLTSVLLAACCLWGATPGRLFAAATSPEELLASARQAFDRKRYGRARREASRILKRYPGSAVAVDAWVVVIDSLVQEESLPRAFEECEKLLKAHPQTKQRSAVLRREFQIGEALAKSHVRVLFFRLSRVQEGVRVLERVIEQAPFGPLADDAVYAIGEAHYRRGDYEAALEQYDRLIKQFPDSGLVVRARTRRAACNAKLTEGSAYDLDPAEQAKADMDVLARSSGSEHLAGEAEQMRDVLARSDYDMGLFYFRRGSIRAGVRYMKALVARHPDSEYAVRARRILGAVPAAYREEER